MLRNKNINDAFENIQSGVNAQISMGKTCKKYNEIFLTNNFYLSRYGKLSGSKYLANNSNLNFSTWNLFVDSVFRGVVKTAEIGLILDDFLKTLNLEESIKIPEGMTSMVSGLIGTLPGAGHGLFRVCTRKFLTNIQLQELKLCLDFIKNEPEIIKQKISTGILSAYMQVKNVLTTSNSSNALFLDLSSAKTADAKLNSIVSYVNENEGVREFKNNGKLLFNIIYEVAKKATPETLKNAHHEYTTQIKL